MDDTLKQRGRISRERLNTQKTLHSSLPAVVQVVERLKAPSSITDEQAEVWYQVVSTEPSNWFTDSNLPLLEQYCRHVIASRNVAQLIEKAKRDIDPDTKKPTLCIMDFDRLLRMQERESRAITTLATKMRLSQNSITNHRGNPSRKSSEKKPWQG